MAKQKDIRTYSDYIDLKNVSTKPFLMISELIDNSISSFDNYYGTEEWGEKLEIEVDFYFGEKKTTKIIHGTKNSINSYIRVTDNAFGMNELKLLEAIRLNKKNKESKSNMNRHGRGLKQCAFYFGSDLEIETWDEKDNFSKIEIPTSIHNPEGEVTLESYRIGINDFESLKKRGTSILIKKIHSNRVLSPNRFKELIDAISFRYIRLIKSGRLEIRYTNNINNMDSSFEKKEDAKEFIEKVSNNFDYNLTKMNEIIKAIEIDVNSAIEGNSGTNETGIIDFPKYPILIRKTFENIKSLLLKSIENKDIEFKWDQVLNINNKKLNVSFWMLEKNKSSYRGYRVYEGDRALLHPPIAEGENGTSTYFKAVFPSSHKSGSTDNRFAGEFNILEINATTSTDKSKFIFEDTEDEEILNMKLRLIWEVFNIFAIKGRSEDKKEIGKTIESKDKNIVKATIESKFGKSVKDVIVNENKIQLDMKMDEKITWKLEIYINTRKCPNKIWDKIITKFGDINKMKLTTYSAHPIWKRIDGSTNFIPEMLVPISILIAHYEISNILDGSGQDVNIKFDLKNISPIDKLNKSGEIIIEKNE